MRDRIAIKLDREREVCFTMDAVERIGVALGMGDDFDLGNLLAKLESKSPKVYSAFLWGMVSAAGDEAFTLKDAKRILTVQRMPVVLDAVVRLTGSGDSEDEPSGPPMARGGA